MSRWDVPCPQCGKLLTIPDPKLLGKKGKCPRCQHRFLLHVPRENVSFQEASSEVEPPATHSPADTPSSPPPSEIIAHQADAAIVAPFSTSNPPSSRRTRRRSRRTGTLAGLIVAGVIVAGGGGLGWWASRIQAPLRSPPPAAEKPQKKDANSAPLAQDAGFPLHGNPTHGRPVSLKFVPLGARIVVHLRPADLWADTDAAAEFRACLGPIAGAIEQQIKSLCLFAPQHVDSALIALIPVSREAFEVAVVVKTTADFKRSDLIQSLNAELVDLPRPHFVGAERVYLIHDARTFASAPKSMKETFLDSAERSLEASEGLETLLSRSDSERHFTLLAELEDVRNGAPTLVPAGVQKLLADVVDFFGDDVEALLWSFQLGDVELQGNFYSDLLVRNRSTRSAANLEKDLKKKLATLPKELLELVRQTQPETVGHTKIIGRFPIMTKVVEQSVQSSRSERQIAFTVELPEAAGPNLASGALLTWDYTTRPSFGTVRQPAATESEGPALPIAERLAKKINVEFRNDFLYVALDYIGGEIGVKFRTDGPGMQRVGVTQNIRQDMKFENTPATAILHEMLIKRLKDRELCLWIDDAANEVVVTSQIVAQEQKRQIFPLQPQ